MSLIFSIVSQVEKIVDSKRIKGKLHYLIRWKGYSADSDTWEPSNTLSCPDLIQKFNEEVGIFLLIFFIVVHYALKSKGIKFKEE